jgi:hypothetical protein
LVETTGKWRLRDGVEFNEFLRNFFLWVITVWRLMLNLPSPSHIYIFRLHFPQLVKLKRQQSFTLMKRRSSTIWKFGKFMQFLLKATKCRPMFSFTASIHGTITLHTVWRLETSRTWQLIDWSSATGRSWVFAASNCKTAGLPWRQRQQAQLKLITNLPRIRRCLILYIFIFRYVGPSGRAV